jgi:hypothetical protein
MVVEPKNKLETSEDWSKMHAGISLALLKGTLDYKVASSFSSNSGKNINYKKLELQCASQMKVKPHAKVRKFLGYK